MARARLLRRSFRRHRQPRTRSHTTFSNARPRPPTTLKQAIALQLPPRCRLFLSKRWQPALELRSNAGEAAVAVAADSCGPAAASAKAARAADAGMLTAAMVLGLALLAAAPGRAIAGGGEA